MIYGSQMIPKMVPQILPQMVLQTAPQTATQAAPRQPTNFWGSQALRASTTATGPIKLHQRHHKCDALEAVYWLSRIRHAQHLATRQRHKTQRRHPAKGIRCNIRRWMIQPETPPGSHTTQTNTTKQTNTTTRRRPRLPSQSYRAKGPDRVRTAADAVRETC